MSERLRALRRARAARRLEYLREKALAEEVTNPSQNNSAPPRRRFRVGEVVLHPRHGRGRMDRRDEYGTLIVSFDSGKSYPLIPELRKDMTLIERVSA